MNIFIGSLPFAVNGDELREIFEAYGEVADARVISDRFTGRSKGFGFVEMDDEAATKAIEELNGSELQGRTIVVNEAQPREQRPRRNDGFRRNNGFRKDY